MHRIDTPFLRRFPRFFRFSWERFSSVQRPIRCFAARSTAPPPPIIESLMRSSCCGRSVLQSLPPVGPSMAPIPGLQRCLALVSGSQLPYKSRCRIISRRSRRRPRAGRAGRHRPGLYLGVFLGHGDLVETRNLYPL